MAEMSKSMARRRRPIRDKEHFSPALTVQTLLADIGRSRRFSKGVGHFKRKFQEEGDIARQPLLVSEN